MSLKHNGSLAYADIYVPYLYILKQCVLTVLLAIFESLKERAMWLTSLNNVPPLINTTVILHAHAGQPE